MRNILGSEANFRALSVKDLLEARDLYHYHLMNKPNVVGTAIGLYLIRKSDPVPNARRRDGDRTNEGPKIPRTLGNSEVRDYSWPCVLAFVRSWVHQEEVSADSHVLRPAEVIPKTLYLPDGRMVPVCVVQVEPASVDEQQAIPD